MAKKQYGFLINSKDCYGCRTCSMACKSENVTLQESCGVEYANSMKICPMRKLLSLCPVIIVTIHNA